MSSIILTVLKSVTNVFLLFVGRVSRCTSLPFQAFVDGLGSWKGASFETAIVCSLVFTGDRYGLDSSLLSKLLDSSKSGRYRSQVQKLGKALHRVP